MKLVLLIRKNTLCPAGNAGGGGAAEHNETDDLSWCWSTLKHTAKGADSDDLLGILFGEINNPAITSIKVKAYRYQIKGH